MKLFLSDRINPLGQALEQLALSRGCELLAEDSLEEADTVILCARRAQSLTLEDATAERFLSSVDYHLKTAYFLSRRAAQAMLARGSGSIVLIGSGDADKPNGRDIGFSAAMGGIRLLFRDLCIYLSGTGVRANLIEPAEVADTDDPQHTAQLALSVAGNPLFCGCEIRTDAAHFHQK